jgi:hypothetical protein
MMLSQIYVALRNRLQEITSLKEVTWYTQQDVYSNEQEIFALPVAYILFDTINVQSLTKKVQMVERKFTFKVRLVSESYEDTEDAVLVHLGLVQLVFQILEGSNFKEGDTQILNTVSRTAIKPEHDLSNLLITEQTFEAIAFDYTNLQVFEKKKVGYHVNTRLQD